VKVDVSKKKGNGMKQTRSRLFSTVNIRLPGNFCFLIYTLDFAFLLLHSHLILKKMLFETFICT
jgi:hypothetical protein